jgi:hypothetical protein
MSEKELAKGWTYPMLEKMIERAGDIKVIELESLQKLFEDLKAKNVLQTCDVTLKHTVKFLEEHELNKDLYLLFIMELGGFCDCEVLLNVEPRVRGMTPLEFKKEAIGRLAKMFEQIVQRKWEVK